MAQAPQLCAMKTITTFFSPLFQRLRSVAPIAPLALILFSLSACGPAQRDHSLAGFTMGTTYSIRLVEAPMAPDALQQLQGEVDAVLEEVNRQMSTYRPDSEISQFNRAGADEPVPLSPGFRAVIQQALSIAAATDGTFDPTVGALVTLWGFGADRSEHRQPTDEQIESARQTVGWRHLSITSDGKLVKDIPELKIDLGAIAKGFGVDQVAAVLQNHGLEHFLVEIGGETLGQGHNANGIPWRVGVLQPDLNPASDLHGIIQLSEGRAMATSGDYQNYFLDEAGRIRSHIIDPRTAAPVSHTVASVSVLAEDCTTADALATGLTVLGPDEGLPLLASEFPGVEALFILRVSETEFEEIATPGFADALNYEH
jgi:FAD:protein FMN transferase